MSAAYGMALIEGGPRRVFGYFLRVQKVTSVSFGDRRSPLRYIRPN